MDRNHPVGGAGCCMRPGQSFSKLQPHTVSDIVEGRQLMALQFAVHGLACTPLPTGKPPVGKTPKHFQNIAKCRKLGKLGCRLRSQRIQLRLVFDQSFAARNGFTQYV